MKTHISAFIISVSLLPSLLISSDIKSGEDLIFPNSAEKICFVRATGKEGALLVGEKLPADHALVQEIVEQMNYPFHQSVIKLSQCARNLSSNTKGPNVLFLSQTEGGFPRQGLILKHGNRTENYPDLFYVDLVLDEQRVARGELDIYSHELGHVMMLNIMGDEIPDSRSTKQHVSMGITDYSTAFFEGWGIHFQRLAFDSIPLYRQAYQSSLDHSRGFARTWHSNIDQSLRLNAVLENNYIHQKLLPAVDISNLDTEELILLEHTSPVFDKTKLKNAQQMLSCEGVLATLFYRINTNKILQDNYQDASFYNLFLLNPIPEDTKPEELFTPMENVFLKNFYVWDKIKGELTPESRIFIEFIKQWFNSFPEDKQEILKLFVIMTVGKTVTNDLGKTYETMSYHGIIGDYQKFRELATRVLDEALSMVKKILADEISLEANIGPQIWIKNEDFLIRTTLWNPQNKKPLSINLNTASEFDLTSFPKISLEKAQYIIKKREALGYFSSLEQAKASGFDTSESTHNNIIIPKRIAK
ncbi:MAG: helix-hairpin-helix domain-containing protein [Candidatus Aminicenantes bacterium]|nr:MAG: helix-hairpin-helix domain-containing protein [Candidatus Aminicenantes bacterium]